MSDVILSKETSLLKRDDEIRRLTLPTEWATSCNMFPGKPVKLELRKGKHGMFIAVYSIPQEKEINSSQENEVKDDNS